MYQDPQNPDPQFRNKRYLEDPLAEHLYGDPDPPSVGQFLRFAELCSLRLQLQQLPDRGLGHVAGELVDLTLHHPDKELKVNNSKMLITKKASQSHNTFPQQFYP